MIKVTFYFSRAEAVNIVRMLYRGAQSCVAYMANQGTDVFRERIYEEILPVLAAIKTIEKAIKDASDENDGEEPRL